MKLLSLSLLGALGVAPALARHAEPVIHPSPADGASVPRAFADADPLPAASWAPADSADSLWRAARIAVAEEDWRRASTLFDELLREHPTSAYRGDALYWRAFALQRLGGTGDLRTAAQLLEEQRDRHPQSATFTSGESSALLRRVQGRLARGGDPEAAAAIAEFAAVAAEMAARVSEEVMPAVAAEMERMAPEIRAEVEREMAAARAEMAADRSEMAREAARMRGDASRMRGLRAPGARDIPPGCEDVVSEERIEALNALMQMNGEQAMPILRRVLERRDRCSEVLRRTAVFLVSQRRGDEAADLLVQVARTDPDRDVRGEAVFWLSQVDGERSVEVLEQILLRDTRDEDLQKRAVFALSQSDSPRAGAVLRDFVRRGDAPSEVRAEAIFWLGQSAGDADQSGFLRELFPSLTDDDLREKAIFAVAQRRSAANAAWLLERARDTQLSADVRKSALFWASQTGNVSAAQLGEIYDASAEDRELRNQVIFALSQRRNDPAAVERLIRIAREEPDRELRRQAVFWLGQSRDPRAAAALEEIINKPI